MAHGCIGLLSFLYCGKRTDYVGQAAKQKQTLLSGGWSEVLITADGWSGIQEPKAQLLISVRQSSEIHSSAFGHKITESLGLEKSFKIIKPNQDHHHFHHSEKTLSIPPETAPPVGSPTQPRCSMLTVIFNICLCCLQIQKWINLFFSYLKMSMDSRI